MTDMLRMEWRDRALKAEAEVARLRRLPRIDKHDHDLVVRDRQRAWELLDEAAAFLDGLAACMDDPNWRDKDAAAVCREMAKKLRGET